MAFFFIMKCPKSVVTALVCVMEFVEELLVVHKFCSCQDERRSKRRDSKV